MMRSVGIRNEARQFHECQAMVRLIIGHPCRFKNLAVVMSTGRGAGAMDQARGTKPTRHRYWQWSFQAAAAGGG